MDCMNLTTQLFRVSDGIETLKITHHYLRERLIRSKSLSGGGKRHIS